MSKMILMTDGQPADWPLCMVLLGSDWTDETHWCQRRREVNVIVEHEGADYARMVMTQICRHHERELREGGRRLVYASELTGAAA